MKNDYKNLQGIIKILCFTKWENCDIICAEYDSLDTADLIAIISDKQIGFIFTPNKPTDYLKRQIINCRKMYDKVYLVTNEVNHDKLSKTEKDIGLINIADKYGLGNIIEEL